jgi:hypothetical protein
MKLPIVKIAELTGIHRDTISKRLADVPFEAGKKGAKLYSSEDAWQRFTRLTRSKLRAPSKRAPWRS